MRAAQIGVPSGLGASELRSGERSGRGAEDLGYLPLPEATLLTFCGELASKSATARRQSRLWSFKQRC